METSQALQESTVQNEDLLPTYDMIYLPIRVAAALASQGKTVPILWRFKCWDYLGVNYISKGRRSSHVLDEWLLSLKIEIAVVFLTKNRGICFVLQKWLRSAPYTVQLQ